MLKLKSVRWKNFLSTGNVMSEVSLDSNRTTLIIGVNGAGKTTMIEALYFALYGKAFRNVTRDELVNKLNRRDCLIEVEFSCGGTDYLVRRGIKPSVFEIYENGKLLPKESALEQQEYLEKRILRIDHRAFCQVVILSTGHVPFMTLPAGHRREVIEDLLDIQVFSTMNQLLKSRVSENQQALRDSVVREESLVEKIALQEGFVKILEDDAQKIVAELRDQIAEAEAQGVKALAQYNAAQDVIKSLGTPDTSSIYRREDDIKSRMSALGAMSISALNDKTFFESHDACPTCKQAITHEHREQMALVVQADIAQNQVQLEKLQRQLEAVGLEIEAEEERQEKWQQAHMDSRIALTSLTGLKKSIEDLRQKIAKLEHREAAVQGREEMEKSRTQLAAERNAAAELTREREALAQVGLMLRDDGIKAEIIKQYIPIINALINKYLADLDFACNLELDENFSESFKSRQLEGRTYNSLSAGEKIRINIALLFAWRAVAKMRNSANINVLVLDEIMDSSLDANGTEDFMRVLQMVADTNAFIISHKVDQIIDKFERVIKFEKTQNFSRMAAA